MTTKTEAASQVRKVLQSIKDRLAQPGRSKVNEATTCAHFLNPLLEALGYESIDDIEFEHYLPDGKTFLDYRLHVEGKALVSVEAKGLDVGLTDKDAAQVISYAAILGDEWAVLRRMAMGPIPRVCPSATGRQEDPVDRLAGWTSDGEFDAIFEQLWLISRESFVSGDGPGSWLTTKKLDQALRSAMGDPGSPEVKFIRKRLEGQGIGASVEQVATWFKARVDIPHAFAKPLTNKAYPDAVPEPSAAAATPFAPYVTSSIGSPASGFGFWIIPAGKQAGHTATEHLKAWLNRGFWGFGESTPDRRPSKSATGLPSTLLSPTWCSRMPKSPPS